MDEWIDVCMEAWIGERMDGWMYRWMNERIDD